MYRVITALLCAILMTATGSSAPQQVPAQEPTFAIDHVTIINVETGARYPDETVVVAGYRISAVGPSGSVQIPAGARVVDGRNKFLIPGLWEMHGHGLLMPSRTLPTQVANGITGIREMGSTFAAIQEARKMMLEGAIMPRLFVSGPTLDGVLPNLPGIPPGVLMEIKTPAQARWMVDRLAHMKVDQIKIHNELSKEVYMAIVDEAKKRGIPFEGHVPLPQVDILMVSDAGQRTVEHLQGLAAMCAKDPASLRAQDGPPIEINRPKCEETIRHLARNGTRLTPTIDAPGQGNPRSRAFNLQLVKMAFDGGIRLLAGTDWPGTGFQNGDYRQADRSPHREMQGLVEAGLTPLEALQTATLNPAILFNMRRQLGTVDTGKFADLVLLDANPLVNISNTMRISAVVANGRLIDAAERQSILDKEMSLRRTSSR